MTTRESTDDPTVERPADSIRFLRSTTVTTVHREADGDTSASVVHTARFAIKPGTVPDQTNKYGAQVLFRPSWLEAEYRDGHLNKVSVTGPRVIKAGLSKKESGHFDWRRPYHHLEQDTRPAFDRTELPDPIACALAYYELAAAAEIEDHR